ncbi:YlqD family protein [Bacillus piscicola]|uniref:YlqD family protein n=1 Tax=Bacillus piscicola TaxID=1632684 RepID=UPI001F09E85F|nr:YlqD family protein [Bacillus piscicola]
MRIIKKVTVKHVLTESFKVKMIEDFNEEERRLERETEQLRFQMQKQLKSVDTSRQKTDVKNRFGKELERRKEQMKQVTFQRSQLDQLPEGSKITAGYVDAVEEIKVGDAWPQEEQEIIVKDGIIISISNRTDDNNGMV